MTALLSVVVLAASTFATPSAPSTPALFSSAPVPVDLASFVRSITPKATCTADCGPYSPVSCTGNVCDAANRSCSAERGHVTCDGNTIYRPVCACTEGQIKNVTTGPTCGCEDGTSTPKDRYKCIGGEWVYQFSFCGAPFCPIFQ